MNHIPISPKVNFCKISICGFCKKNILLPKSVSSYMPLIQEREKGPPGGRFSPIAGFFLISDTSARCRLRKQTHLKRITQNQYLNYLPIKN